MPEKKKKVAPKKKTSAQQQKTKMPQKEIKQSKPKSKSALPAVTIIILIILVIVFAGLYFLQPAKFKKEKQEALNQTRSTLSQQIENLETQIEVLQEDLEEKEDQRTETVHTNQKYNFELAFPSTWGEISATGEQVITGDPFQNQLESREINIVSSADNDRKLTLYVVDAELKDQAQAKYDEPLELLKETENYLFYYKNHGVLNKENCSQMGYEDDETCNKFNKIDREIEGIVSTFKLK